MATHTPVEEKAAATPMKDSEQNNGMREATFGAGCFWCVEAVFQQIEGVLSVTPGYAGGYSADPTYEDVCSEKTGHAEVCRILFDPDRICYDELLEVFWKTHDPTTQNRQGPDTGTQYRSIILYHTSEQKEVAERYKEKLNRAGIWKDPIVTEIVPCDAFYPAEDYHRNYFNNNKTQPYCSFVIKPKIQKVRDVFREKLAVRGE